MTCFNAGQDLPLAHPLSQCAAHFHDASRVLTANFVPAFRNDLDASGQIDKMFYGCRPGNFCFDSARARGLL